MPLVRPDTVQLNAPVDVQVLEPGVETTEYSVIAAPPFEAGAVQEIVDAVFAYDVARTVVGAPGTVDATAAAEAADATEAPLGFVAVTVNV